MSRAKSYTENLLPAPEVHPYTRWEVVPPFSWVRSTGAFHRTALCRKPFLHMYNTIGEAAEAYF